MKKNIFSKERISSRNPKWEICTNREDPLYPRTNEIRSQFMRDYNRILHCTAYRRLKHKTQVFPAPANDHICTRIEHVNLVASASYTISTFLGLNTELTQAISVGHDLGHAPFGHVGEKVLNVLSQKEIGNKFWHEKNGLRVVDEIETLEDPNGKHKNLNLTYAVRDGIVCHCGEIDENGLFPRSRYLNLEKINKAGSVLPYTWEGCVVKMADKIAYLGRDIEDAMILKILTWSQIRELGNIIRKFSSARIKEINNTVVLHELITDLCNNSSPEKGIRLSNRGSEIMTSLKEFNYRHIYFHDRLNNYKFYAELIMKSIFHTLKLFYSKYKTQDNIEINNDLYPLLTSTFKNWLDKYSSPINQNLERKIYNNKILYNLRSEKEYLKASIDFISGMSDNFAIRVYDELTSF